MKNKKILIGTFILILSISMVGCKANTELPINVDEIEDKTELISRKNQMIEQLDNIQIELDKLPEKEDSDKGITNAMKNYYGLSYEAYDEKLNEIYQLLKNELSKDTMEDLKAKQIEWIKEKEKKADVAKDEFKGGTFETVAMYISLYESTKERCYFLVNNYILD